MTAEGTEALAAVPLAFDAVTCSRRVLPTAAVVST